MTLIRPVILTPAIFGDAPVVAAFTTRHGGHSEAPYRSLNLGMSTGDETDVVMRNRAAVFSELGHASSDVAFAGQVHGTHVERVEKPGLYRQTDGLVTTVPGLMLAITAADCAAVLMADPDAGVIGACHAGWRGAAGGIVESTVAMMQELGAVPARMRVYVSPCISQERFEVGPEVAEQFDAAVVTRSEASDRAYLDLKADIASRLRSSGIDEGRMEVSSLCTSRAVGDFFSHRAEAGQTGRMLGLIALR